MFDSTDISTGISEAFPPSLTHGCAEKVDIINIHVKKMWIPVPDNQLQMNRSENLKLQAFRKNIRKSSNFHNYVMHH